MNLTAKQELFARCYVCDPSRPKEAARKAGYKVGKSNSTVITLMNNPKVQERITAIAVSEGQPAVQKALDAWIAKQHRRRPRHPKLPNEVFDGKFIKADKHTKDVFERRLKAAQVTAELTFEYLANLALGDRTELFDDDGRIRDPKEWPEHLRWCFESVKEDKNGIREYKFVPKAQAIRMLGEAMNLFAFHEQNKKPVINIVMDDKDIRC